jgi:hypothetical protein
VEIDNIWTARLSAPATAGGIGLLARSSFAAQVALLGQPAAGAAVLLSPISVMDGASGTHSKINYIGKAASLMAAGRVSVSREHQARFQLDKVKGVKATDARGIPPRGRPV